MTSVVIANSSLFDVGGAIDAGFPMGLGNSSAVLAAGDLIVLLGDGDLLPGRCAFSGGLLDVARDEIFGLGGLTVKLGV